MKSVNKLIKLFFSDYVIGKITGIFYGWHGNYSSWSQAKKKCTGYEDQSILDKVITTSLKVKSGEIAFERDSVPFNNPVYSYPVLSALLWASIRRNSNLNVLDFGGSLGSSYFQNSFFLKSLNNVNWCIIEQPHYVRAGRQQFEDDKLHFYYDVDECMAAHKTIDVVLLSSVLQYLEHPYDLLAEITSKNIQYILIDRTLLFKNKHRITLQKVPRKIYDATYPCWILNERKILEIISRNYRLIYDFEISGPININCQHKGYFFETINTPQ